VTVSVGLHSLDRRSYLSVSDMVTHQNYHTTNSWYDVGVVTLQSELTFDKHIGSICLPPDSDLSKTYVGDVATAVGWGITEGGSQPNDLKRTNVTIIATNDASCQNQDDTIDQDEPAVLCAGISGLGGKDACKGDSGNSLFLPQYERYTQVGVVAYGEPCTKKLNNGPASGVYVRVTHLKSWITQHAPGTEDSDCGSCSDNRVRKIEKRRKRNARREISNRWIDPCSFAKD